MIKFLYNHNILDERFYSIVVPVNAVGVMGAGLAREWRDNYPDTVHGYMSACHDKSILIKGFVISEVKDRPPVIFLTTKYHHSEESNPDLIRHSLKNLKEECEERGIYRIAMPKIGTGLGKLSWLRDVFPIIEEYFAESDIDVLCYVFR